MYTPQSCVSDRISFYDPFKWSTTTGPSSTKVTLEGFRFQQQDVGMGLWWSLQDLRECGGLKGYNQRPSHWWLKRWEPWTRSVRLIGPADGLYLRKSQPYKKRVVVGDRTRPVVLDKDPATEDAERVLDKATLSSFAIFALVPRWIGASPGAGGMDNANAPALECLLQTFLTRAGQMWSPPASCPTLPPTNTKTMKEGGAALALTPADCDRDALLSWVVPDSHHPTHVRVVRPPAAGTLRDSHWDIKVILAESVRDHWKPPLPPTLAGPPGQMVTLHVVGNKVDLRPLETVLADRKSPDRGKAEAGNLVYLVQKNLEDSPMDFCAEAPLIYFLVKLAVGAYAQKGPLHRAAILGQVVWNIAQKFELEVRASLTSEGDSFGKQNKWAKIRRVCRYVVAGQELLNPRGSSLKVLNVAGPDGTSVGGRRLVASGLSVPRNTCVLGVIQVNELI